MTGSTILLCGLFLVLFLGGRSPLVAACRDGCLNLELFWNDKQRKTLNVVPTNKRA